MREFEFDRLVDAFGAKSPDEGLDAIQTFLAEDLGAVASDIYLLVDKVDPDDSSRSALCRLYPDWTRRQRVRSSHPAWRAIDTRSIAQEIDRDGVWAYVGVIDGRAGGIGALGARFLEPLTAAHERFLRSLALALGYVLPKEAGFGPLFDPRTLLLASRFEPPTDD
jgi:hypothetical protein